MKRKHFIYIFLVMALSCFCNIAKANYYQLVTVNDEPSDWSGTYLLGSTRDGGDYVFGHQISGTNSFGIGIPVTVTDGRIVSTPETDGYAVTLTKVGSGYTISYDDKYLCTPTHNQFNVTTDASIATVFNIAFHPTAKDLLITYNNGSTTFYLRFWITGEKYVFRIYNSDMYSPVKLYRYVEDSTVHEEYTVTTYVNGETTDYIIADDQPLKTFINNPTYSNGVFVKWVSTKDIDSEAVDVNIAPTGDMMLYAVFSRGGSSCELVNDASTMAENDQIIVVAKNYDIALGPQDGDYRKGVDIIRSGSTITDIGEATIITLIPGVDGKWALCVNGSKYLRAYSGDNARYKEMDMSSDQEPYMTSYYFEIVDGEASVLFDWITVKPGTTKNNRIQYVQKSNRFNLFETDDPKEPVQIYRISELSEATMFIDDVVSVSIGDSGYASFSSQVPVSFAGSGITAYVATRLNDGETSWLTLEEVESIPGNTGVVLHGATGDHELKVVSEAGDPAANLFQSTAAGSVISDGSQYALGNKEQGVAFYRVKVGETIPAYKAYLTIDANAKEYIPLDDVTGIKDNLFIKQNNGEFYTIDGIIVDKPRKGIFINNGKKVIIR